MPRAFSEQDRDRIRQRLLQTGRSLLGTQGIRKLSVDRVVAEAGISKGSFYAFFPSREDFVLAVFEALEDQYRSAMLGNLVEGEGSLEDRLAGLFTGMAELVRREPALALLQSRDIAFLIERLPPERLAAHQARDREVLEGAMRRLCSTGAISPEAVQRLPGLAAAFFSLSLHRNQGDVPDFSETLDFMARAAARELCRRTE